MAYGILSSAIAFSEDMQEMESLKARIQQLQSKKVPAVALVVVALAGMIMGVIAANTMATSNSFTGEIGTYHNNAGTMTVADSGLGVVANTVAASLASATFGASGTNLNRNNALTAGNWMEQVVFTGIASDTATHTATVTVKNGTGPAGTTLLTQTLTLVGGGGTNTGTVTLYMDLGTNSLASPVTVYVTVT